MPPFFRESTGTSGQRVQKSAVLRLETYIRLCTDSHQKEPAGTKPRSKCLLLHERMRGVAEMPPNSTSPAAGRFTREWDNTFFMDKMPSRAAES